MQNFLSAATGIALAVALIRGFARQSAGDDRQLLGRSRPGSRSTCCCRCRFVIALVLVWQGVPQNFAAYVQATTLEGAQQTIAQGPVASQVAIKMLGTNGGGFFNANSAHPYENPTALSNLVQMLAIFVIGAALTNVFGRMVGNERQGWAILGAMADPVRRRRRRRLLGGSAGQPGAGGARRRSSRRQHGRQGGAVRHRRCRRCSRRSPRPPPAAR